MSGEKLGEILIKKGLINYQQLTKALEFQSKLSEGNYMQLGEILIKFEYINREQLLSALDNQKRSNIQPPPPPPPANIFKKAPPPPTPVIKKDILQPKPISKPIGEILIEKGFIQRFQLTKALEYQASLPKTHFKPIGEVLVDLHYITREQLDESLGIQPPKDNNSLGEILKQLGIIDESQLALVLMQQHSIGDKKILLGELLVQHGFINQEQLNKALEIQKKNMSN